MSRTPRLSDLQLILLATGAQRDDGSIYPPPENIRDESKRIAKAIPSLLRRALIEEVPVDDRTRAWREENHQPLGLVITSAARAVIAAEEGEGASGDAAARREPSENKPSRGACVGSKAERVLRLLRRPEGATIAELTDATEWLPHTTRAALTGFRKKGHVIDKSKRDEVTCYRIAGAA
jgi:hypothetical protein